jgi:hypothetical protein
MSGGDPRGGKAGGTAKVKAKGEMRHRWLWAIAQDGREK